MILSRWAISRADGVFLMVVSAWALASPILKLLAYTTFFAPYLPILDRLPLAMVWSMVNDSVMLLTQNVSPALNSILWILGVGTITVGAVLAACGWGLWRRKAWAAYLLFGIAVGNVLILSVYLIRMGIPDMLRHHMVNTSYQAMLLALSYYSSVVMRFAVWKIGGSLK